MKVPSESVKVYSENYVDQLIDARSYDAMATLRTYVEAASPAVEGPGYGLPTGIFVFTEALIWFAQAARSGAWAYYETTSQVRQELMRDSLGKLNCESLLHLYFVGMRHWKNAALNELADDHTSDNDLEDFTEITRRINGGTSGLKARFALYKQVYGQLS